LQTHSFYLKNPSLKYYATSSTEFSLGILLNFPEDLKYQGGVRYLIEKSLKGSIEAEPSFSLPYWILSQFYYITGNSKNGDMWAQKANLINPLHKDLSFLKLSKGYRKKIKNNSLFVSLPVFLKAFKPKYHQVVSDKKFFDLTGTITSFVGTYHHFYKLKETPLSNENIPTYMQRYIDSYYLTPLMAKSIFENLIQELISKKQFEWALLISKKLKSIKPEYNFREIFGDYEEEIIKMELVSAN
jgi:hypothetical protein